MSRIFMHVRSKVAREQLAMKKAKEQEALEHRARLEIAFEIANAKDGIPEIKRKAIQKICKQDPKVYRILRLYHIVK